MRPIDIDESQYENQLAEKLAAIKQLFCTHRLPEIEVFRSPHLHYRMRAEFRVWHQGDDLYHIMFDPATKEKYRVERFPPASKLINQVMQELIAAIKGNEILRRKLFQIDYLSSLSEQIVVTLTYHKPLDEDWVTQVQTLKSALSDRFDIHFIGRARKQKIILDNDYVIESLPIRGQTFTFKQVENSFTQPNAAVNCKMIEWALDVSRDCNGDLLELYCGLGNFSLPLATQFRKVLATEISKTSVAAAQFNIQANQIENLCILRMSSEEFVQAVQGERQFRRLQGIDLANYDCQTVLVDPPRAGLDDETIKQISQYQHIIYISCNPETLKSNLDALAVTHAIERFALFDQFPYTHHAECGVFLTKRAS